MGYLYLALAISLELIGTTCLKYSEGFTKLYPSLATLARLRVMFLFIFQITFIPAFKHCLCNMVRYRHCSGNADFSFSFQ